MATTGDQDFAVQLATLLAGEFLKIVQDTTQSRKIRDNLVVVVDPTITTGFVVAEPYWARFYHDGRGVVPHDGPKSPGVLVWYKNPDNDPRLPSGGAIRAIDVRRLTKPEFDDALKNGLIVISKSAGPAPAHPFFLQAEADFVAQIDGLAVGLLVEWLQDNMPTHGEVETSKATLRIKF